MSLHDRLGGLQDGDADVLNPRWVTRHRGDCHDFLSRHRRQAREATTLGRSALKAIAPSLLYRVSDERTLYVAWNHLRKHGGRAPGPDGLRYDDHDDRETWRRCRGLRNRIRAGKYAPRPERVVMIAKGPGRGRRPLVIQSVLDRVVQRTVVEVVQPFLDPLFDDRSLGFRPGRGRLHALALAERLFASKGRKVWVTEDVRDAFLHVPLARLLQLVRNYLPADDLTDFIGAVLGNASTPGLHRAAPCRPCC